MGLIDKLTGYCAGSRALAWLLAVTVATGLLCILLTAVPALSAGAAPFVRSWLSLSGDPLRVLTRPWTLATYMAVHFSVLHLLFNALWLYWFGILLLNVLSGRRLLFLFIYSGTAGGALYVLFSALGGAPASGVLTGDSAAVLGIMTAAGILMPDYPLHFFLIGRVKTRWVALVCVLLTFFGSSGSEMAAHAGGVIYGAIAALSYRGFFKGVPAPALPKKKPRNNPRHKPRHNPRNVARAMQQLSDHERLDELLDKIRLSGYGSLTEREKTELDHISSRIKKE